MSSPNPQTPPPLAAADSSPDLPPLATPASAAAAAAAAAGGGGGGGSGRRLPPPCWTHEETLALIDAYRDKWQELRRGNLRAGDWDGVAAAVTARCGRFPTATPKSGVQCRHKIEKLRKRYRAERVRSLSRRPNAASPWPFFPLLHDLASTNPNSKSKPTPPSPSPPSSPSSATAAGRSRSLHHLMSNGSGGGGLRFTIPKASRSKVAISPRFVKVEASPAAATETPDVMAEEEAAAEVAAALRAVGEGYLRMEERKMEMTREMEKARMEMEMRRLEMVLDAQRVLVDAFLNATVAVAGRKKKKAKVSTED